MAYTVTYIAVTWTSGDTITETKMDNMVSNDQCYDAFAAEGMMMNNNIGYSQKEAGGTRRLTSNVNASDICEFGNTNLVENAMNVRSKISAYLTGAQDNLVDGTPTKVLLDTEDFDVDGGFASNVYTTTVPGYYIIMGMVTFLNLIATKRYRAMIYVDGSAVATSIGHGSVTGGMGVPVFAYEKIPAAKEIALYATSNSGGNTVDLQPGASFTYMGVQLISIGD